MASIALLVVVLPAMSQFPQSLGMSLQSKDLWLARGSIILLTAGTVLIRVANVPTILILGLTLFSFDGGYSYIMRSLISTVAQGHHIGILLTTIGLMETAGSLMSGQLLAVMFRIGLIGALSG